MKILSGHWPTFKKQQPDHITRYSRRVKELYRIKSQMKFDLAEWFPNVLLYSFLIFKHMNFFQCLGFVCCLECGAISFIQKCQIGQYEPVEEDLSFHLQERHPILSPRDSPQKVNQITHNYKPINYQPIASTSRAETTNYLLDDVQPCSSKSSDPYRLV